MRSASTAAKDSPSSPGPSRQPSSFSSHCSHSASPLKSIDVGIGYAVWAGIGAVGAAVFGPVFFDETLTLSRALWLTVIIGGVIWLKLADSPKLLQ